MFEKRLIIIFIIAMLLVSGALGYGIYKVLNNNEVVNGGFNNNEYDYAPHAIGRFMYRSDDLEGPDGEAYYIYELTLNMESSFIFTQQYSYEGAPSFSYTGLFYLEGNNLRFDVTQMSVSGSDYCEITNENNDQSCEDILAMFDPDIFDAFTIIDDNMINFYWFTLVRQ